MHIHSSPPRNIFINLGCIFLQLGRIFFVSASFNPIINDDITDYIENAFTIPHRRNIICPKSAEARPRSTGVLVSSIAAGYGAARVAWAAATEVPHIATVAVSEPIDADTMSHPGYSRMATCLL